MIKVIYLFIILSLTGFITIWIKNDPGLIAIEWQGWLIETSAAIIISIIIIIFLTIVFIYKILAKIFSIPKNIQKTFRENKSNRANKTIIKALSAKNMGEMELAEKLSLKAKFLNNDPLKLLLDSEISNYNGNEEIYIKKLNKMLDHPETMLLGIKNLSNFYFQKGDSESAIKVINKAPQSKNTPNWFFLTSLKLNILEKNWDDILKAIKNIEKYTKISKLDIKHIKSRIYLFKALEYNNEDNNKDFKYIDESLKNDPSFAPAIIFKAKLLYSVNDNLAFNFIKKAWKKFSHPDIADFVTQIYANKPKNELLKTIKALTKLNNKTFINNITLAKAAISIGLWSVARQSLKIIPEKDWTKDIYMMMADLEKKEHGNITKSDYWINKAKSANLDFVWGCTSCTYISKSWSLICPKCNSVDTIKWQQFNTSKNLIPKTDPIKTIQAKGIIEELNIGIDR